MSEGLKRKAVNTHVRIYEAKTGGSENGVNYWRHNRQAQGTLSRHYFVTSLLAIHTNG